jgi:hypothetical protein
MVTYVMFLPFLLLFEKAQVANVISLTFFVILLIRKRVIFVAALGKATSLKKKNYLYKESTLGLIF